MTLRPYQIEALDALENHLRTKSNNPCVVAATGSGKSFIMAEAVRRWKVAYAPFRAIVLAHRKELVDQNAKELKGIYPEGDIGIYAAGLKAHETDASLTFAAIDSVYNKADKFKPFDVVIVDEAHRIPLRGEGKYLTFISACKEMNPNLRVIGFTATPYRLGSGVVCHKDYILNEICYETNIGELIRDGYLSSLRSKVSRQDIDLSSVKKTGGDYQQKSLGELLGRQHLVTEAVEDALTYLNQENRKCAVWFCVDVNHCEMVTNTLIAHGESAVGVTGETSITDRDKAVEDFRSGKFRHILNVNVFTEGFNVKQVDAIILLRPTLSKGLYLQMTGRGLRIHHDKKDCLILDYAHCIETHGPIDAPFNEKVRVEVCGNCQEVFARGIRKCPKCGWEIPKRVIEERERVEAEKKMHEAHAAQLAILGSAPAKYMVDAVMVSRHIKNDTSSLCVSYRAGVNVFREWICLDHEGYARSKAEIWWRSRFNSIPPSVDTALSDIFLGTKIKNVTKSITVKRDGKYFEIISYELGEKQ